MSAAVVVLVVGAVPVVQTFAELWEEEGLEMNDMCV